MPAAPMHDAPCWDSWPLRMARQTVLECPLSQGQMLTCSLTGALSSQVPGALLLRDSSGNVFAVQTETLQQVSILNQWCSRDVTSHFGWMAQQLQSNLTLLYPYCLLPCFWTALAD